jgi:5'-methylthioadenosine phosphorylase
VLSELLVTACRRQNVTVHPRGTYVCIEGPQFSTRGESLLYRSWGMDVIGMTNATEARLAREAEIGYATLAMACDYDCWHDEHESVTAEIAINNLLRSADNAQRVIRAAIAALPADAPASCAGVLRNAILTQRDKITVEARRRCAALLDPYLGESA